MKNIEIGQELYSMGLGWGMKTFCFKKEVADGKTFVISNNGTRRLEEDVLNNSCDLYSDKEKINQRLSTGYMSKLIK